MKKYEILEHKADLRIRVFSKTKEKLFQNALLVMTESMKPEIKKPGEEAKRRIEIKSIDSAALLVDFLNETLCLSQTNKEFYSRTDFDKFSDTELIGELFGQKVESFGEDIKAVTHHNLEITQNKDGWEVAILFDI